MQRDFKVVELSLKGKHKTPTVALTTVDGERLTLKLESRQQLDDFEIDQEFTVRIGNGSQAKLPGAQ